MTTLNPPGPFDDGDSNLSISDLSQGIALRRYLQAKLPGISIDKLEKEDLMKIISLVLAERNAMEQMYLNLLLSNGNQYTASFIPESE